MADPFVAEIRILPFNFAPTGWAFCDGQLLPLSQHTALFSLLGTTYGGNGKSTFALPNMQGNAPMHAGQGPGLSPYELGETAGAPQVTLIESEMPAHSHPLMASTKDGTQGSLTQGITIATSVGGKLFQTMTGASTGPMNLTQLQLHGQGAPHNNMMPFLTLNFCIALQGVFPPRS